MTQQELKTLLQDYVATANDPAVNGNWNKIDNLFPELANVNKDFLKDYVATANDPKVSGNWDKINSLFPETGIKPEDPKTKTFTGIKEIDLKRDDKGEEGTFYDKLFYSEQNAVTNLRKHYDTDNNDIIIEEGVAPDSIWGNWLPETEDNVYIKNEAGEEKVFKLPSTWNSFDNALRQGKWGGTIKEINDFINEGRRNKDPNYTSEKKGLALDITDLLDNKDFLTDAMGTDADNWKYIAANDDDDKKELTKKIKEKFGKEWGFWFDPKDEYSTLNEYDIEKAIEKSIDAKLHVYNNQVEGLRRAARKQVLDVEKTSLFQFGKDKEREAIKSFSPEQKEVYFAFDTLKNLIDDEDADPVALQQAHANLVEKRKKLGTILTEKGILTDENGNTISDITQIEGGGFAFGGEELSARERELSSTYKGSGNYLESLNHASSINFVDMEINQQDGETYHDIVINDASAHGALLRLGYTSKERSKNGFKFRVKKKHLGGSYNHLVKGDGFDFYHDMFNHKFGSLLGTTLVDGLGIKFTVGKNSDPSRVHAAIQRLHDKEEFKSRDGYFGLLEFDDKQTFKGKFWDQNEYEKDNNDLSKAFKRSLKDWSEDSRRLSKDRVLLNEMFLMNSDPGSNVKTWDLSAIGLGETKAPQFIKKHVLDPVHRGGELLGEGFSHAGGFDIDPFMSSKRSVNDAVEAMSYNTGLGLTDDQKDRMHRGGAYKVMEGVAGFVPAIVEFALIDVALKKVGAITGIPKLIDRLTKVHKINKKVLSGAELTKLATKYSKASGKTIKVGDDAFEALFSAEKGAKISKAAHTSRQMMLYHTAHALKEEGKMKIAFEDDYKLGMGTGFYLAGRFLPRFQSAQYNKLNTALRVGRSGVAGMLGVQAASQLEAVVEDLRGNATFRKHIVDNYSDLSEAGQSALVDFFVFSIVGARGAVGEFKRGVGFTGLASRNKLEGLRTETNEKLDALRIELKKDPQNTDLIARVEKLEDLRGAVSRRLTDLYRDINLQDPEKAEKHLEMIMEGNMKAFSGENKIKYEAVVDVDPKTNIGKTKDGKEIDLDGDPAKFNRTNNTMYFDTAQLTHGKVPHEIGHALYWNMVKNNPELAEKWKGMIKDSFGDAVFTIPVKDKETGRTIEKDVNIEDYVKHAYGKEKNFEAIKAEEYVMHALEVLGNNAIYSKIVGKGTWNSLKNDMNKFTEQHGGFTLWKAGDAKKQMVNFLANFARSAKQGKLTAKQMDMFKALNKKEWLIEGIEADSRTPSQKNKEKVIKDVDKEVKSKKNKLASAKIQEKYETKISNLTGTEEIDKAVREMIKPDPKNPKTSVAGAMFDPIVYDAINRSYPNVKDPAERYILASDMVFDLSGTGNRGLVAVVKQYKKRKSFFETVKNPETGEKSERFTIFDKEGNKKLTPTEVKELEEKWDAEAGTQEFISKAVAEGYKGKQNLTKTVMQHLGLRIHEIKERGLDRQSDDEYQIGFRRDIDDYQDLISDKGPTAEEMFDFNQAKKVLKKGKTTTITLDGKKFKINPKTVYTEEGVNIREILDINESGVARIKEVNRESLLKAKPEDATFFKLGEKALKVTTEVLKEWFGREEGVAKKDYYEPQRERIYEHSDRLYESITLTSHPKFYENSMVGRTIFKKYFKEKVDKNGNKEYFLFTEMPTSMTPKERAAGPTKWEKEKLENLPENDLADLVYSGRKDTHEKKVNELIAKVAKPLSQGILREQLNNPEFQRQLKEKNRELYEYLKVQNAIEQLRGATPENVASKKSVLIDPYNTMDKFLGRAPWVWDDFSKEFIKLDFEGSKNIEKDLKDLVESKEEWKNLIGPHLPELNKLLGYKLTGDMLKGFIKVSKAQRILGTLVGEAFTPIIFKGAFQGKLDKSIGGETQKFFLEYFKKKDIKIEELSTTDKVLLENLTKGFQAKLNDKAMVDYYFNKYIPELLKDMPSVLVNKNLLKQSLFFTGKYKIDPKVAEELGIELTEKGYISSKFVDKVIEENPGVETKIIDSKGNEIKMSDVNTVDNGEFKLQLGGGVKYYKKRDKKTGEKIVKEVIVGEYQLAKWKNRENDPEIQQKLTDHIINTYLKAKGAKTYEDTISANERLQEYIFTKMFNHYSKSENKLESINGILLLLQAQTNIGGGFVRSLATHTGVSLKLEDVNRSEHPFQVLHFSGNTIMNMLKNSGSEKEFLKNYRPLARLFKQTIIPESLRERVDGLENGGSLGNVLENLKDATDIMSEANFIHDIATLSTILNLRTGKTYDGFLSGIVGGAKGLEFLQQARKNLFKSIEPIAGAASKKSNLIELNRETHIIEKAKRLGLVAKKEKKGMSTFDFDETVGVSENYIIATKGKETRKIASNEWPVVGEQLRSEGWKLDFTDFNKVTKGKPGPLMEKLKNQIKKFGNKNVFILTARDQKSAKAIHEWLKSEGVNLPLKNITGLGNSTGEAKAMWMLEKFSEGYNDMYFVDDALSNVKAVKDVLDQLDVKSKVQQAMASKKSKLAGEFSRIIEESRGIARDKTFSAAAAKEAGKGYKFFVAPSVMDMRQLIKPMLAKGKLGIKQEQWFKDNFLTPYGRGINDFNIAKNQTTQDYSELLKLFPEARKKLKKKIPGSFITYENAIRLHRWKEAGFDMTEYGLSKAEFDKAVETVEKDPQLLGFSRGLGLVSKQAEGYIKPTDNWTMESISTDLFVVTDKINLKKYLADWIERKNEIFSKKSLDMLEHELGTNYREALEDVLWRMEHNSNRNFGNSKHAHTLRNINNATVAGVMFFNIRSATLQLISTVNYLNFGDNNIFKAGARLMDLPQFTKDFVDIWNSDMMVQRRRGLKFDIAQQEIMEAIRFSPNKATAALRWMLEKGYIPTKYADNFAIAFGGASYLRNRINTYKKTMSEVGAKKKAWEDFTEITQERQQSSRPDFISQQQAGVVGSLILNWGNTPMQMFRIQHKEISDLAGKRFDSWTKGDNSAVSKVSKIMYYGAIQSAIFYSLQTALLAVLGGPDEDKIKEKEIRTLNGMLDSYLLGWGMGGKAVSTVKNTIMEYVKQNEKDYNANHTYTLLQALNFSPPVSVKARKLYSATQTMKMNKDEIAEKGFSLDNPALDAAGKIVSVATNVPLDRVVTKLNNVQTALNNDLDNWQRIWLMLGWNKYNLSIDDPNINRNKKKKKSSKKVPYATY